MTENQKYKKVRNTLDGLKYLGTLHPDSITLVESILKDLMKITGKHNQIQKKLKQSQSKNKSSSLSQGNNENLYNDKIDYLNQKNYQLETQNKKLKQKINSSESEQKILLLQSKLSQFQIKYTEQIQDMVRKSQQASIQISQLSFKNHKLIEDNNRLKQKSYQTQSKFEEFNDELKQIINKKSKEIKELQESNSKLRIKISTLQSMLEQLKEQLQTKQRKDHNHAMNNSNINNNKILKDEIENLQKKLNLSKRTQDELNQEKDKLRKQNKKLNDKITYFQNLDLENKKNKEINNYTNQRYEQLYDEIQEKLNLKQNQLEIALEKITQFEKQLPRQSDKIKDLMKKNNFLQQSLSKLNEQINQISIKLNQKTKQLRQAENKKVSLQRQVQQLQSNQRQNEQQLVRQKEQLSFKSTSSPDSIQKIKLTYENQIKLLNKQILIFKQNEHHLIIQKQKISIENQKLHRIIEDGNKQLQVIQNQKQTYLKENKQLKNRLQKGNMTGFDSKNEIIRLQEKNQSLQMFVDELKSANRQLQNEKKILQEEALSLQKQVNCNQMNKKELFEDNKQLILQVKSLQTRKEQIFSKFKQLQQSNSIQSSTSVQYKKQYYELKNKYSLLMKQLQQKNIDLINFDQQRDNAINELDKKCEQVQKLKFVIEKYELDLREYNKGLNQSQLNFSSLNKKIEQYEEQIRYLSSTNQQLDNLYNKQARKTISDQEIQIKRLENELNLILMGNRQIERQNDKMRQRLKDVENKKSQKFKEFQEQRQKSTTLSILNKQLAEQLKVQRKQLKRISTLTEQLQKQNHKMFQILTCRDRQLQQFSKALNNYELKQNQYMNQIAYFEKQINQLSEELDIKERQNQEIILERDSYKAQRNWRRDQSINSISESNIKNIYQTKNDQLKQHYEIKKNENQKLRGQIKQLEHIISDLRRQVFMLEKRHDATSLSDNRKDMIQTNERKSYQGEKDWSIGSRNFERRQHPQQCLTPIKTIMAQSLVHSHHENDNQIDIHNKSSNSENINYENLSNNNTKNNNNNNIHNKKGFGSYLADSNSEYEQQSERDSKISKHSVKQKYDRLLQIQAKYSNTMKN